ncbi:hypothetical protein [Jiella mangrovi]|uniref:Envelope stress response membrane protein PspB n=1 Tax=Jiella mangrovi TaxID=2821407 RepID=A0ABS4BKL6_9HYPH|nr:hypothetical protein [Jiella mangrovi]MBP0617274.1 hypothetical protein [Jiella mangrovi]
MSDILAAWLPVLLLVVVVIWLMRRSRRAMDRHVADTEAINNRILEASRETVQELRQIRTLLEERS